MGDVLAKSSNLLRQTTSWHIKKGLSWLRVSLSRSDSALQGRGVCAPLRHKQCCPTETQTVLCPTETQTVLSPTETQAMLCPTETQAVLCPTEIPESALHAHGGTSEKHRTYRDTGPETRDQSHRIRDMGSETRDQRGGTRGHCQGRVRRYGEYGQREGQPG